MNTRRHDIIFAIGDVHGHAALLRKLHAEIESRLATTPGAPALLVHLGDLIDRGPDSRGAVEAARVGLDHLPGLDRVTLRGNHEDMMLSALFPSRGRQGHRVPGDLVNWLRNGGDKALSSWDFDLLEHCHLDARVLSATAAAAVPPEQVAFIQSMPLLLEADGFAFVHAGFFPGAPPAQQQELACLWIRDEFLSVDYDFGALVVHGHTISEVGPEITGNRLNIDTGAFATGLLTCAVLTPGTRQADFLVAAYPRQERLFLDPQGIAGDEWCRWAVAVSRADPGALIHLAAPEGSALHLALERSHKHLDLLQGQEWRSWSVSRFGPDMAGIHSVPAPRPLRPYINLDLDPVMVPRAG